MTQLSSPSKDKFGRFPSRLKAKSQTVVVVMGEKLMKPVGALSKDGPFARLDRRKV